MSYTAINSTEIQTGKPVAAETQTKVKDNFNDHEARLLSLEGGAGTAYPPLIFRVNGPTVQAFNSVVKTTINFTIQVTGVRILVDKAGSAGTLEVDIKYKRGAGAYTSILSTRPSVLFSAGDDALSTNAVLDGAQTTLQAGDILRLDLTSVQTGGISFLVRIDFEAV